VNRLLLAALLWAPFLCAQRPHPATWTLTPQAPKAAPGAILPLELKLTLAAPWHMYSLTTPKPGPNGGPIATTIKLAESPAVTSFHLFQPAPKRQFDPNFGIDTETYEGEITFFLAARIADSAPAGETELTAQLRYQLCTEKECLPPKRVTASAKVEIAAGAAAAAFQVPAGYTEFKAAAPAPAAATPKPASAAGEGAQDLWTFLLVAFGVGIASIFTPCVFPMIPITMSFFLNKESGSRGRSLVDAIVFSLGIIVLFAGIGLALTAALGPFAVVQLGSNVWVNGFITLVFFLFSLSLFGAFEITLPSGLLTRLNSASSGGGYGSTLLMGLTFSLTSFACVGPLVGSLLAASVSGDRLRPAFGMLSFAAGLASPFFLLALFPGYLKSLPRSGGWLARTKIVMGFLLLAAMLKYASSADRVLQWNLLSRERFLGAWIVLFALAGLYLLGLLRLEGIKADDKLGAGRLLAATLLLAFSVSLVPGLFGAPMGELEALLPYPSATAAPGGAAAAGPQWRKNQLDEALAEARSSGKLVLVSFTGYACTNCHWMKANMFPKPEIAAAVAKLILVELYTDGTDAASERNQQKQQELFSTVAIPFYALLRGDGTVVASFAGLTRDAGQFKAFLETPSGQ
jgi:thiol:disulfide interchange protein DsbD